MTALSACVTAASRASCGRVCSRLPHTSAPFVPLSICVLAPASPVPCVWSIGGMHDGSMRQSLCCGRPMCPCCLQSCTETQWQGCSVLLPRCAMLDAADCVRRAG